MSESADVVITTVMVLLAITSIIGNSLVCAVIMKNRDMRTSINYLLENLAVGDTIFAIFYIPKITLSHISSHPEGTAGRYLCTWLTDGNLGWIGADTSVFTLVAIAMERYFAVIYPHGNKGKLSIRKLKVIIPGLWISSVILNIPIFLKRYFVKDIDPKFCIYVWPEEWMLKAYFLAKFAFVVIPLMLMVGSYTRVVYNLWFKRNDDNERTYQQQGVLKVRKRVTLMVVTVTVIFGICWGTDLTLHVIQQADSQNISSAAFTITHTMIMFNAAVNPFAYALISQRFRRKIKEMIWWCPNSSAKKARATVKSQGIELCNNEAPLGGSEYPVSH